MKRRGIDFEAQPKLSSAVLILNAMRQDLIDAMRQDLIDATRQDLIGTARQDLIDATRHATSLLKPRMP